MRQRYRQLDEKLQTIRFDQILPGFHRYEFALYTHKRRIVFDGGCAGGAGSEAFVGGFGSDGVCAAVRAASQADFGKDNAGSGLHAAF